MRQQVTAWRATHGAVRGGVLVLVEGGVCVTYRRAKVLLEINHQQRRLERAAVGHDWCFCRWKWPGHVVRLCALYCTRLVSCPAGVSGGRGRQRVWSSLAVARSSTSTMHAGVQNGEPLAGPTLRRHAAVSTSAVRRGARPVNPASGRSAGAGSRGRHHTRAT